MNLTAVFNNRIKRKIATIALITASLAAYASLGDGGKTRKNTGPQSAIVYNYSKNFSLRSDFKYKSNDFLSSPESKQFIMLNTVVTYQKGNTTYIMPLKKKVLLEKINFSPLKSRF